MHPPSPSFLPGDTVVPIACPETGAVTVSVVVDRGRGDWRVGYMGPYGVTGSAPAAHFILAPKGWQDAPLMPAGHVRLGLSEADRQAVLREDEADPEYQDAMRLWKAAREAWDVKYGRHPDILRAREANNG